MGSGLYNFYNLTKFSNFAIILELKTSCLMRMARTKRTEFPGAFYHVLARGNNKQTIFRDEQDYKVYMLYLKKYHKRYKFTLYAYTLMPNHIHLLIETAIIPLSKIMQGIQQSYTYYFHKKYKSVGHIFQGRYKAILCERETYLLELVRYVHLNPVRASLVSNLDDYPWSSHSIYLGHIDQPFVEKEFIFKIFSENECLAVKKYLQFTGDVVDEGHRDLFSNLVDQIYLGSPEFVRSVKRRINNQIKEDTLDREQDIQYLRDKNLSISRKRSLPEILKIVSETTKASPESLLSSSKVRKISTIRSLYAFIASRYAGFSNKSLAEFLGRDISNISNMIRKTEKILIVDDVISDYLDEIIKVIKA
jgi:putative transposase